MYEINWDELKSPREVVDHAVKTAFEFIEKGKPAYAAFGGPMLCKYSERGIIIEKLGIEILQIAGCEIRDNRESLWAGTFNGIMHNHSSVESVHDMHIYSIINIYSPEELKQYIK